MHLPNLNDLIQDLQTAKQIAIEDRNPNAIVIATMSQSKLLGLDKPIKDVTSHNDITKVTRVIVDPIADYSKLNDVELRQLQAITLKLDAEY